MSANLAGRVLGSEGMSTPTTISSCHDHPQSGRDSPCLAIAYLFHRRHNAIPVDHSNPIPPWPSVQGSCWLLKPSRQWGKGWHSPPGSPRFLWCIADQIKSWMREVSLIDLALSSQPQVSKISMAQVLSYKSPEGWGRGGRERDSALFQVRTQEFQSSFFSIRLLRIPS